MAGNKAYAVYKGRAPGVYLSWEDCEAQVIGFPGALYRGFKNQFEAEKSYVRFLYGDHPMRFAAHMSALQQQVHAIPETYENVASNTDYGPSEINTSEGRGNQSATIIVSVQQLWMMFFCFVIGVYMGYSWR